MPKNMNISFKLFSYRRLKPLSLFFLSHSVVDGEQTTELAAADVDGASSVCDIVTDFPVLIFTDVSGHC